jgi:hypothetical protein
MKEGEYPRTMDRLNLTDTLFTPWDDEHTDIIEEQLEDIKKWAARRAQLEILSQMDEGLEEKLRKKEIFTYSRINKVLVPPPLAMKELPPPPIHDLLPYPAPTNEYLFLNIDVPGMIGKINMPVPMVNM